MEIPRRIQRLSDKPGVDWSDSEIELLKEWLSRRQQMQTIWFYAARYLGKGATRQDVEDATVDFYSVVDQARRSYRPGGPDFIKYLLHVCFRNNCIREGNKLRKRINHETPLEFEHDDQVFSVQVVDTSAESDPSRRAQNLAFALDVEAFLNANRLPEKQREVFILRYLEGMSYESISETTGSPVGSIKGWLNRATVAARLYLEERGWSECHVQK
jgi:RNA polymerase sigma-70 factor (ECF subfamily)